jgi:hypothetical protein
MNKIKSWIGFSKGEIIQRIGKEKNPRNVMENKNYHAPQLLNLVILTLFSILCCFHF